MTTHIMMRRGLKTDEEEECPVSVKLSSASRENAKSTETVDAEFVSLKLSLP